MKEQGIGEGMRYSMKYVEAAERGLYLRQRVRGKIQTVALIMTESKDHTETERGCREKAPRQHFDQRAMSQITKKRGFGS